MTTRFPVDRVRLGAVLTVATLALLPVHNFAIDIGFALKPWIVTLAIATVLALPNLLRSLWDAPVLVRWGAIAMVMWGVITMATSEEPIVAFRHLLAIGLGIALIGLWLSRTSVATRSVGIAVRISAIVVATFAIVESGVLISTGRDVSGLAGIPGFLGPLGELIYGDIPVANALHVDSNFAALYAVCWLFLIRMFPLSGSSWRRLDGMIQGLLLIQLAVAFSRSATLALAIGVVVVVVSLMVGKWPKPRLMIATTLITMILAGSVLVVADSTDEFGDLAYSAEKRLGQVGKEAGRIFTLIDSIIPRSDGSGSGDDDPSRPEPIVGGSVVWQDRSTIWAAYIDTFQARPILGLGYGVQSQDIGYGHNLVLEAASGGGIISVAALALLWGGAIWAGVLRIRTSPAMPYILGGAATFLTVSFFITTNYEPLGCLFIALLISPPELPDDPDEPTPETQAVSDMHYEDGARNTEQSSL